MKTDKRELIINAAEKLMSVIPNKEISIQMIARQAGIGKGSIYYYFESKEEIINAVIQRCYRVALREYFSVINKEDTALEKIKSLFRCMIKKEFRDKRENFIIALNLHEDLMLQNQMKLTAVEVVAPVLAELLEEGVREGSLYTDTPKESAEMIVAVITFLLDNSIFPSDDISRKNKLSLLARVLETSLGTQSGSFDFLYAKPE